MVLDGNSIINRAYYGVRPLTTRDGFFTHAIFGFLTMLGRLLDEEKPEALCVAFDRREPTFRHLEYEGYKATRHAMPEELAMQMPVLKDVLDAMNIPRYELAGFEADDLIGTISRKCESAGWDCVVATGDKDSLQLVTEHTTVKLISTRMGQTTTKDMTPESFREVYGFAPIHIVDLKALMGDASDNIPGVPGVGEKTAMALIQKYQSIDEIYRLLPDIEAKPNVIKKLTEGEESARQSFHLATIVTDAPLEFSPQDNLRKAPSDALYPLFMKLEFTKLIDKYGLKPPADIPAAEEPVDLTVTAEAVTTAEKAKEYLSLFRKAEHVTLLALPDLSGVIVDFVAGESTAVSAEFYFSRYEGDWNALLRALFSNDIKKVSHNVKDLQRTLLENDLPIEGFIFDTALAGYLLDATAGSYDLQRLFVAYYNEELPRPVHLEPDAFSMLGDRAAAAAALLSYTAAVAALGIVKKLDMLPLYFSIGVANGLLPLLATRDFMITPQFLKLRYKIASERVEFPTVEERAQLSEPNAGLGGTQGALLARDSFEGFLAAVSGARAMRGAAIGSIAIAVMGGAMGMLVLTFLTFLGATLSASCWNLFLYTLLWLAPGILITSLSSRR